MNRTVKVLGLSSIATLGLAGAWFLMASGPKTVDSNAPKTDAPANSEIAQPHGNVSRQNTPSASASELPLTAATPPKSDEYLIRGVNWNKYPGTLGDQVRKSLETKDSQMSFFVAERVSDCITYVAIPDELSHRNLGGGLGSSAEDQRMKSLCQSIEGDWREVSHRLYAQAIEGEVRGAAAAMFRSSGKLTPSGSKQIAVDASAGHLWSALTLAAVPSKVLGVPADSQLVSQQAIKLASSRVDAKRGEQWLDAVQQISKRWADTAIPEQRTPTAEELAKAEAMAAKIVAAAKEGSV